MRCCILNKALNAQFTISWATSSGTSLLRSKENSIASLSLYFPLSFFTSSILSHSLIASISPSSSSANSTRTPVSSWKKAWFRRSLIEYLNRRDKQWAYICFPGRLDYPKPVVKWLSWRPLILVLANASLDDFLHFRNGHLVKAARLHPLKETQNPEWEWFFLSSDLCLFWRLPHPLLSFSAQKLH